MNIPNKKRIIIRSVGMTVIIFAGVTYAFAYLPFRHQTALPRVALETLPSYTTETLAKYNGTNDTLPIYIALDGFVYDVTPGKKFYGPLGEYHSIAGKDASKELHVFGGSIIKEKYKVIGVIVVQ